MKKNIKFYLITIFISIALIIMVILFIKCSNKIKKLDKSLNEYKIENKNLKNNEIELTSTIEEYKSKIEEYNNNPFPYKEKSCTYTDTYEFIDYFNYSGFVENQFYIIVDKDMTKEEPKLLMLDQNKFEKNFVKNQNYEITFNKRITYKEDSKTFDEKTYVIKIEKTNKKGMEQTAELCILN